MRVQKSGHIGACECQKRYSAQHEAITSLPSTNFLLATINMLRDEKDKEKALMALDFYIHLHLSSLTPSEMHSW